MADYTSWLKDCAYRKKDEEMTLYQGVGPGNTALIFYGASDLDTQFLANCFSRYGGIYGKTVSWLFQQKGQILVSKWQSGVDESTLMLEGLGAGAEDVRFGEGDLVEIITKPKKLQDVADILELEEIALLRADLVWMPPSMTLLEEDTVIMQLLGLLDEIMALEGIWNLTADFWIVDEKLENFV